MAMIKYVKGDLFGTKADIIAHGCNCRGVMGSGVAKIVRDLYPKAYNMYVEAYEADGWWLGEIQTVLQPDGKYIANCMTQNNFLPRNVRHADYAAIEKCMWALRTFAIQKQLSIAMPKIGSGLAGGDWNVISEIIERVFATGDVDVTVYYLE